MGEPVASFGYPLADLLPSSGNFTMGHITATAGLRDNPRHLQISNPVQPGNSGGPLFDMKGGVVGIVASRLIAHDSKDVPQNVNFAIKADVAIDFLDANGVPRNQDARETGPLDPADLATAASEAAVHIRCTPSKPSEPRKG
jgi:S1-C subfamily serine protease